MTSSHQEIAILFADADISRLFHALVSARGAASRIIDTTEKISPSEKLITEPQYAASLAQTLKARCLVVGNQESDCPGDTLFISRPLTEEKIEEVLERLFSSH